MKPEQRIFLSNELDGGMELFTEAFISVEKNKQIQILESAKTKPEESFGVTIDQFRVRVDNILKKNVESGKIPELAALAKIAQFDTTFEFLLEVNSFLNDKNASPESKSAVIAKIEEKQTSLGGIPKPASYPSKTAGATLQPERENEICCNVQ